MQIVLVAASHISIFMKLLSLDGKSLESSLVLSENYKVPGDTQLKYTNNVG